MGQRLYETLFEVELHGFEVRCWLKKEPGQLYNILEIHQAMIDPLLAFLRNSAIQYPDSQDQAHQMIADFLETICEAMQDKFPVEAMQIKTKVSIPGIGTVGMSELVYPDWT